MTVRKTLVFVAMLLLACLPLVNAETITVTNTNFDGPGSLSQAILDANADPSESTIVFDIPGSGTHEILSIGGFPFITSLVTVNGANPTGTVVLVGGTPTGPGAPDSGLQFMAGSEGSTVTNLNTEGFLNAINIEADNIVVTDSTFNGSFARSIKVTGANGALITRNIFTANESLSIHITSGQNISIFGNSILSGNIIIVDSSYVYVGGSAYAYRNMISNSCQGAEAAVLIYGTCSSIQVVNNIIKDQDGIGVKFSGPNSSDSTIMSNLFSNNSGWDILGAGSAIAVIQNQITGDQLAVTAGISFQSAQNSFITGNMLDGARIELVSSSDITVGGVGSDSNTIVNDTLGFSGSAAVRLDQSSNCVVIKNVITENASNGVLIQNSSNNTISHNQIFKNGRTGVRVESGVNNKITLNQIFDHMAAAAGGMDSISLLGSANNGKEAPVITSMVKNGDLIDITGTTSGTNDVIELYKSDDKYSRFTQNAKEYIATVYATGTTWSASISTSYFANEPVAYVTASATDTANNTSEFAYVENIVITDGICGPVEVDLGVAYTYSVADIPGTNFQWWVAGDATVTGNGSNEVSITFGTTFISGYVNVGYTDPVEGWVVKQLAVFKR